MNTLVIRTRPVRRRAVLKVTLFALTALALAALALWLTPDARASAWPTPRAVHGELTARLASAAPPQASEGTVNINAASLEELMRLPGVGAAKASRVIEFRQRYGAFKRVDDLTKVKGFGQKTLRTLRPYLSTAGATTYKGKPAGQPRSRAPRAETH
jgi:competence protein ComEA